MVLERACDDLGRGRGAAVDEDRERMNGFVALVARLEQLR